jgi:hypothetical protein
MYAQTLLLRPIRHGWAVYLTKGSQLARFRGPYAQTRPARCPTRVTAASQLAKGGSTC